MKLKKFDMENWFEKTKDAKYNFSESGVPDISLNYLLKKTNKEITQFGDISLGNNDIYGSISIREKISKLYKNVKPEQIITTTGSSEGIYILFNLILNEKSKVLLLKPSFPMLYLVPKALNCKVYEINMLKYKSNENLINAICLKIKKVEPDLIIINTPHNPTGLVLEKEHVDKIINTSKKIKTKILFDEHYRYLPFKDNNLESFFDIYKSNNNIFAVGSVNKCLGIVGVRLGWVLLNNEKLKRDIAMYKNYTTHCIPKINEKIVELGIENIEKLTEPFKKRINRNWELLKKSKAVKENILQLNYNLEGGCIYFPKTLSNSKELSERLFKKYSISVMPGEMFNVKNHIRINLSLNTKNFKYLLETIYKEEK